MAELATRLSITHPRIVDWETRGIYPRLHQIAALALVFGITPAELLSGVNIEPERKVTRFRRKSP